MAERPPSSAEPRGGTPALEAPPEREEQRAFFDGLYRDRAEPWDYSRNAAELLRHDVVARSVARRTRRGGARVLDVGCSLGQITARLAGLGVEVHALDLSPTAVARARARCEQASAEAGGAGAFHFAVASACELPYRPASFDALLLCDGLVSWRLTDDEARAVLRQAAEVVKPDGAVVLTEALKPGQIGPFIELIERGPLEVESVRYLNDRLWFSLERALRPVRHRPLARRVLASRGIARILALLSRLAGPRGTKHLLVIARPPRLQRAAS